MDTIEFRKLLSQNRLKLAGFTVEIKKQDNQKLILRIEDVGWN